MGGLLTFHIQPVRHRTVTIDKWIFFMVYNVDDLEIQDVCRREEILYAVHSTYARVLESVIDLHRN